MQIEVMYKSEEKIFINHNNKQPIKQYIICIIIDHIPISYITLYRNILMHIYMHTYTYKCRLKQKKIYINNIIYKNDLHIPTIIYQIFVPATNI